MRIVVDASALERLLGGDSTLEIELRTGIANQFADKFLKSLVNSQLVATTGRQIEQLIQGEILSGPQFRKTLAPKYQKIVEEGVSLALSSMIREAVKEAIDSGHYETMLKDLVHQESSRIANEWTASNIEDRIARAADQKIKNRLGL
jgi:hypothetical protein